MRWRCTSRRDEQRPILTVNKCPQFVRQVTGDIRQLRPAIHVVPVDEKANDTLAVDVLPEMVRYIERRSDAKAHYFSRRRSDGRRRHRPLPRVHRIRRRHHRSTRKSASR